MARNAQDARLHHAAQQVARLKPGEAIAFDHYFLREIGHAKLAGPFGPTWSPTDRILENVVGSSYEIRVIENFQDRSVTFHRMTEPLNDDDQTRTYVSPDHRERGYFEHDGQFFRRVKP